MFIMPSVFGINLFFGASTGNSSDVSRLRYFECRMEKEVRLPMLEGGAVGGEDDVKGCVGCGRG